MSFHVSPPFEGFATRTPAGEIISSHTSFDARSEAGTSTPEIPDTLSVSLGHMGVVIAISTAAQGLARNVQVMEAQVMEAQVVEAQVVEAQVMEANAPRAPDTIHLQVADRGITQYLGMLSGSGSGTRKAIARASMSHDPVLRRLTGALEAAERSEEELGGVYADAVRLAIVTRVLSMRSQLDEAPAHARAPVPEPRRPSSGLPKWRLKRVAAYIDENIEETISLAGMASAAGLSRMHFAAQFRVSTGVRPHEYLLRRRIERAQAMMLETRDPLVQVALGVGFQTQAHFTTVFRRFVGDTPYQWRCANRARN